MRSGGSYRGRSRSLSCKKKKYRYMGVATDFATAIRSSASADHALKTPSNLRVRIFVTSTTLTTQAVLPMAKELALRDEHWIRFSPPCTSKACFVFFSKQVYHTTLTQPSKSLTRSPCRQQRGKHSLSATKGQICMYTDNIANSCSNSGSVFQPEVNTPIVAFFTWVTWHNSTLAQPLFRPIAIAYYT